MAAREGASSGKHSRREIRAGWLEGRGGIRLRRCRARNRLGRSRGALLFVGRLYVDPGITLAVRSRWSFAEFGMQGMVPGQVYPQVYLVADGSAAAGPVAAAPVLVAPAADDCESGLLRVVEAAQVPVAASALTIVHTRTT